MTNSTHDFPLISIRTFHSINSDFLDAVRQSIPDFFDRGAVLLFDKPSGWTSFDVVNKIRRITQTKKVGHCGTLDPFATGLLIVCTGKATKIVDTYSGLSKTYLSEFELGKTTDTLDCEGKIIEVRALDNYTLDQLRSVGAGFIGEIEQTPPAYSAIKINGVAAYKLARKGKSPVLKPRKINIDIFDILEYEKPLLKVKIHCSKGTYIRSVADDFGKKLGCGAYVKSLHRESIGSFLCEEAMKLDQFLESINKLKSKDVHTN